MTSQEVTKKNSENVNEVSFKNPVLKKTDSLDGNISLSKQKIQSEALTQSVVENNEVEKETEIPDLDYITAYRNWQYFKNCYTDVEDFHNDKDPLQTQDERFKLNSRESQNEPTVQQKIYYQRHVDICKSLMDDESDNYYQVMMKLKQKLDKVQPKTEEELQLQKALSMMEQYEFYLRQYNESFQAKPNLPVEEINRIQQQISQLNQELYSVYEGSDPLSEEDVGQIERLQQQIDELRSSLEVTESIDQNKVMEAKKVFYKYIGSMDAYLQNVSSPDAFLLLATKIYQIEYAEDEPPVISNLKNKTGILDSQYINNLNSIVFPLVACSMNYPCDAESDFVMNYCLGLKDSMFNQACGKSLEDFYFSFYIGSGQLADVNTYFNFLMQRYAQ